MGFTDEEKDIGAAWGMGTESRNPFETGSGSASEETGTYQTGAEERRQTDRARVNMNQGSWNDGARQQNAQAGGTWQGGAVPGGGGSGRYPQQPRKQGGSTAGKILLVVGMILRGAMLLVSVVSIAAGSFFSYGNHQTYSGTDDFYSGSSPYSFDFSEPSDPELYGGQEDPGSQGGQSGTISKDDLEDSELEDTSEPLTEAEAQEITSSAVLGMNTSLSKPAAEGQWIKTRKTIDGEACDVYFRITDVRPMDSGEILEFNNSQNRVHLVPTSNPDFVDLMCTYEIYYPEGTPADRHQKDFYCNITSKTGTFKMKDGTVYQDSELDDVYDVTVDPDNSVTRENEIFTGKMTYAVTKDCSEYYIVCEDMEAAGMVWIYCTYEQGA